jgi:UPF0271 protein
LASKIYDASAFYAGIPFASTDEGCTTPLVFGEIKHIKQNHGALDVLLETGRLRIIEAGADKVRLVVEHAKKTGDFQEMSEADISAVALALELGGQLITDDFAISNLAKTMSLDVRPAMTRGIRDVGKWSYYCAACEKEFSAVGTCQICGNKLRRKLLKGESF